LAIKFSLEDYQYSQLLHVKKNVLSDSQKKDKILKKKKNPLNLYHLQKLTNCSRRLSKKLVFDMLNAKDETLAKLFSE
jgi:hypothetical protein